MRKMSHLALAKGLFAVSCLATDMQSAHLYAATSPVTARPAAIAQEDLRDAYIYLLGRLLVMRQQQLDFKEGMGWNQLVHRKPGAVDWPNPNLDVAYSEAWVALDEDSCTQVSVPKIIGRYYTVQLLNGWGETLANINERRFPKHPYGEFALCLKGAKVALPAGAVRIDLPVRTARVLTRVELGADREAAERLQHRFSLKPTGSPVLPVLPAAPDFEIGRLPGVEAFDFTDAALAEPDLNPGMQPLQAKVRAIAAQVQDPAVRAQVDAQLRSQVWRDVAKASAVMGNGTVRKGWGRPSVSGAYGSDYLTRTLVDYGGIWANTQQEVRYYRAAQSADGKPLDGGRSYALTFTRDQLPEHFAHYFWSVTAVNSTNFRVLPNAQQRFLLNNQSGLKFNDDGSLTLYFGPQAPAGAAESNWLPTVAGQPYRLILRYYGAKGSVATGDYFPPALENI